MELEVLHEEFELSALQEEAELRKTIATLQHQLGSHSGDDDTDARLFLTDQDTTASQKASRSSGDGAFTRTNLAEELKRARETINSLQSQLSCDEAIANSNNSDSSVRSGSRVCPPVPTLSDQIGWTH